MLIDDGAYLRAVLRACTGHYNGHRLRIPLMIIRARRPGEGMGLGLGTLLP